MTVVAAILAICAVIVAVLDKKRYHGGHSAR
jgi:hypothetical protein